MNPLHSSQLDQCLALEARSDDHPWGHDIWHRSLAKEHCLGWWEGDKLVAISAFSLVLDEVSLLNIIVDIDCRGCGYGRLLLAEGLEWMQQFGGLRCILEVRDSNVAAQKLYRGMGFHEDGRRKNYYPDGGGREDALLMSSLLPIEI